MTIVIVFYFVYTNCVLYTTGEYKDGCISKGVAVYHIGKDPFFAKRIKDLGSPEAIVNGVNTYDGSFKGALSTSHNYDPSPSYSYSYFKYACMFAYI